MSLISPRPRASAPGRSRGRPGLAPSDRRGCGPPSTRRPHRTSPRGTGLAHVRRLDPDAVGHSLASRVLQRRLGRFPERSSACQISMPVAFPVVSRLAAPTSISPRPQPTSRTASSPFHDTRSSRRSRARSLPTLLDVHHPGAGRREAHPAREPDTRERDARRLPGPEARGRRGPHQEPGTPGQEQVADDARGVEPVVRAARGPLSTAHCTPPTTAGDPSRRGQPTRRPASERVRSQSTPGPPRHQAESLSPSATPPGVVEMVRPGGHQTYGTEGVVQGPPQDDSDDSAEEFQP